MQVTCVHIHVKPGFTEQFLEASLRNARATLSEPGNLRFDVLQSRDDPERFMFYEVFVDLEAIEAHKLTTHYQQWRDLVQPWMLTPRQGVKYEPHFPLEPEQWVAIDE